MKIGALQPLKIAIAVLSTLVVLVAGHYFHVFIYAHFLSPGGTQAAYEEYALSTGPLFAALAGPFVMALACWLVFRRADEGQVVNSLIAALLIAAFDIALLSLAAGAAVTGMVIVAHATKLLGAFCGGLLAEREQTRRAMPAQSSA